MRDFNDIRRGRHCVFALHVHLVFVTKYRRGVLNAAAMEMIGNVATEVCRDFSAELLEMDGEDDHVHLLIQYPPTLPLVKLVNSLKGVTSRMLQRDMPSLRKRLWKGALWSPSYFAASCGGAPIEIIRQYIEQQRTPL